MLTWPKNLEGSITIIGEKGTARIGGVAVSEVQHWQLASPRDYDADVTAASYETTSVYGFGHPLYYRNVIDTPRGESEPETDGREGIKSLEVLIAAYSSARDRKTVSLPLEYCPTKKRRVPKQAHEASHDHPSSTMADGANHDRALHAETQKKYRKALSAK